MINRDTPNILLINPWVHDFTAFDLWARPLGLLYIASTLRQFGYQVQFIDCLHHWQPDRAHLQACQKQRPYGTGSFYSEVIEKPSLFKNIPRHFKRYGMPPEEFLTRLREVGARCNVPLLICVTSHMTYWYPGVFEAIRRVKSVFPSAPVALGGIYASLCYEHARDNSGADYVIKGPGELEVLKLADSLCEKAERVRQRRICRGTTRPLRSPRDYGQVSKWVQEGSLPAYALYSSGQCRQPAGPPLRSIGLLTSRGCPFRCSYCASFLLGPGFVRRAPGEVVAEIEYYIGTLGVRDIAFYDDALFVDPSTHILPILELLIKKGLQARYHTPNGLHPRYINLPLARLLHKAGFKTLRLGFEGTSERVQRASDYKARAEDLERAIECLWKAGYVTRDVGVYILVGLPGQTVEEVVEAMEFVNKLGARIKLAEYSPIPGTAEFQKAAELCPQVAHEPLGHNKSTFTLVGMGIDYETFEELKTTARRLNDGLLKLNAETGLSVLDKPRGLSLQ
jgi:radical SAM superfamily enzyme YgiQ (UPF0313 family)